MFAFAIAAFTFTSCEDVPAPYDTPQGGQGGQDLPEGVYLDQNFTSSLGDFNSISENGELEWYNDYSSAMCTGYQDFDGDGQKENQAGITWLVSKEIDLTEAEKAYVTINHAINYERGDINENNSILISKDFTGDVTTATWKQLVYNTDGLNSSFDFVEANMNIPADYVGGKIVIALRHTCTSSQSSTWEVKSLMVQEGEVEETPDTPDVPTDGIILDQDFTSSLGDFTSVSASGTLKWYNDFKSAMCTGYQDFDGDGQKENQAGVTYFISPELSLFGIESAYMTINHAINYERGDLNENNSILISKDYKGDVNAATWEQLTYNTAGLGSSFTFVENNINIPVEYIGSNVVIAFRHTCNDSFSSTWEVKSIKVQEGKAEDVEEPGGDDEPGTSGEGLATVTKSENIVTMVDPDVTTTGSTVTCDLNTYGWSNAEEVESVTLDDGTTIGFSIGEGTTTPKFYTGTKGVRLYALNTMAFSASKKIAKIVLTCDIYDNTNQVGNPQLYTEIDGNAWTLVNDWTENKGGTQLRVQTIEITYAE